MGPPNGGDEVARRRPVFNLATGGRSPTLPVDELAGLGFNLVVIPTVAFYPAVAAMRDAARAVLASRSDEPLQGLGLSPMALFELVGMKEWDAFQSALTAGARKPV